MNSNTKTLLIIGALGAAAIYAAQKSGAFSDGTEAAGSLGGTDDSITAEGNPFARIDPNYQYPNGAQYFYIAPDGSVSPTPTNPDTGETTIITPEGDSTSTAGPASTGGYTDPTAMKWYENPLIQGAGFAAGYLAVEGTIAGVKKINSKASGDKLVTEAKATSEAKLKSTEKSPMNEVREKMGFRANERLPEQDILRAKYTTEADFSSGKISEVKGTGKIMSEEPSAAKIKVGEGKIGKAAGSTAEAAGKALIIGHVVSRSFNAWNEYGSSYLEQGGLGGGSTLGSTAKATAVTGAVAGTGILGDLFSFGTGLIYRPGTSAEDRKGETTGWFATEKDLWGVGSDALRDPGQVLSGITGAGEVKKAITGSDFNYKSNGASSTGSAVNTAPAPLYTSSAEGLKVSAYSTPAPSSKTSSNVNSSSVAQKSSSSSSQSSSAALNAFTAAATTAYGVSTVKSSSSGGSSSSKSSSSSSSSASASKPTTTSTASAPKTSSASNSFTSAASSAYGVSTAKTSSSASTSTAKTTPAAAPKTTVKSVISNAVKSVTSIFKKK